MSKNDIRWFDPQGAPQGSVIAIGADGKFGTYPSSSPVAGAAVNRIILQRTTSYSHRIAIGDANGFSVLSDDGTTIISSASQQHFGTACYEGYPTASSTDSTTPHGAGGPFQGYEWYNSSGTYYNAWAPSGYYNYTGSTWLQWTFPIAKMIRSVYTYNQYSPSWQLQRWTPATAWTNVGSPFTGSGEVPESGASTDWRLVAAADGQCRVFRASFSEHPYHGSDTSSMLFNADAHLWLIKNPSTGNVRGLFSASATAPTLPSGYTKKKLITRTFANTASVQGFVSMLPFYQENNTVCFKVEPSYYRPLYYVIGNVTGPVDFGSKMTPSMFKSLRLFASYSGVGSNMTANFTHTNTGFDMACGGSYNTAADSAEGGCATVELPSLANSLNYTLTRIRYVNIVGGILNLF